MEGGCAAGHPTKSAGSQDSLAGSVSGSSFHTPEKITLVCQYPLNSELRYAELQEDFPKECVARQGIYLRANQFIHTSQHGHEAPSLLGRSRMIGDKAMVCCSDLGHSSTLM